MGGKSNACNGVRGSMSSCDDQNMMYSYISTSMQIKTLKDISVEGEIVSSPNQVWPEICKSDLLRLREDP